MLVAARVLPLRETFLIQVNDFDRLVEFELKRILDPVAASRVPQRRSRAKGECAPFLALAPAPMELAPEAIAVVEPIVATLPARPAGLLS